MNIIRELRKKKNIQQKDLAEAIGVSNPTVSDWETGKKDPSGERLKKLAQFFGVDELMILGKEVVDYNLANTTSPKTIEAKILASGIDRLPRDKREHALDVMRVVFAEYSDFFTKGNNNDAT